MTGMISSFPAAVPLANTGSMFSFLVRIFHRTAVRMIRWPLSLRVLLGVVIGAVLGATFQTDEIFLGWSNVVFGQLAGLYVQLLTALATPLVFFAILDAFVQTSITGRQGLKMFCICVFNVVVAFVIGLTILNTWEPGTAWRDKFSSTAQPEIAAPLQEAANHSKEVSLGLLDFFRSSIPHSIVQPFSDNTVLTVAMLAIFIGVAFRSLSADGEPSLGDALITFKHLIIVSFQIVMKLLLGLIELAPLAICLAVAGVVGESGWKTFEMVSSFLMTVGCGLAIHSLIYYPLSIWLFSGISPYQFFREGGSAILTGFSLNSSLATSPLTLESLRRLGVGDSSARLSACVGTNFNNDGVTLYEAITALFIAQAIGFDMSIIQQVTILLAALIGSMGIAGIPNSGLIILALVLKGANLPEKAIQIGIPLVFSIDFVIARMRSAVNVMGDLQVAILLDATEKAGLLAPADPSRADSSEITNQECRPPILATQNGHHMPHRELYSVEDHEEV